MPGSARQTSAVSSVEASSTTIISASAEAPLALSTARGRSRGLLWVVMTTLTLGMAWHRLSEGEPEATDPAEESRRL